MKKTGPDIESGLRLPRQALLALKTRGIYARPAVSLEHQHLARRYVLRGIESGGAVGDLGRYVTFADETGEPIDCLHPVDAIGVNGVHAIVIAPAVVRIDMLRKGRTYELLITRHHIIASVAGGRPKLQSELLFRGIHGRLESDLHKRREAAAVMPTFYSLAGEEVPIPRRFVQAVQATTQAVNCVGCSHSHYVRISRRRASSTSTPLPQFEDSPTAGAPLSAAQEVAGVDEAA